MLAMLCYGALALFSTRDDLGNPGAASPPHYLHNTAGPFSS
jgi:hypothetical protein